MITVPSTQFQNKVGEYLRKARKEPVSISHSGHVEAVLLSIDEYKKMEKDIEKMEELEDIYWCLLAKEVEKDPQWIDGEAFFKMRLRELEELEKE